VLKRLGRHVKVLDEEQEDLVEDWLEMPDEQFESRVLQLIETGDRRVAVKLLAERRGYTTTEAKLFVDELNRRLATPEFQESSTDPVSP
jgi:hypothetical protein